MALRLHRLIYCSRYDLAEVRLEAEVAAIIYASVRNNQSCAVTGMLLVHAGYFVQALEGAQEAVLTTYARICNDRRHHDARVLFADRAETRAFGDWAMCAQRITPSDNAILQTLSQKASFAPHKLSGAQALRLLTTVRRIQSATQQRTMT